MPSKSSWIYFDSLKKATSQNEHYAPLNKIKHRKKTAGLDH